MSRPMTIAGRAFTTKKAVIGECQRILYAHPAGTAIAGDDLPFLVDLIGRHPHAVAKIGAGIDRIEVRVNPVFSHQRGFWIVRVDGTVTDFSFLKCLAPEDHRRDVLHALRLAVVDQILAFKARAFAAGDVLRCPVTGDRVTESTCHVDHAPPTFEELAALFAASEGGWQAIALAGDRDRMIGARLADDTQAGRWRAYHQERARLRIVTRLANLSVLRRTQPPGGTMTSINVVDGIVTLFVTVSAEYTNEETEPILHTAPVRVPRHHPLVRALVTDAGYIRRADGRDEDPAVVELRTRLAGALSWVLEQDL
jgi:hypothetical protein